MTTETLYAREIRRALEKKRNLSEGETRIKSREIELLDVHRAENEK